MAKKQKVRGPAKVRTAPEEAGRLPTAAARQALDPQEGRGEARRPDDHRGRETRRPAPRARTRRPLSSPVRWNADPDDVQRSVAHLVLTLVEFIRRLLERQAIRRMEAGTLTGLIRPKTSDAR